MLRFFLVYGMPFYLIGAELLVRALLGEPAPLINSGPNIGVAGLSLVIPTIVPKALPSDEQTKIDEALRAKDLDPARMVPRNRKDAQLTDVALPAFLALFLVWVYSLYRAHQNAPYVTTLGLGFFCSVVGIVFTEWKERV